MTEDTFKLTEGLFRFEALGDKAIKGKKTRCVYRVIAPSSRRTRFDVSAERGLTPFVGRQRELELVLDGFERAKEGEARPSPSSPRPESASPDSSMSSESCVQRGHHLPGGEVPFLRRNVAYHPIADLLKANFDIQDADTDQDIREKVPKGLQFMKVDEASASPFLLELLSVKTAASTRFP